MQLLLGWLPVWALYSTLMLTAHPGTTARQAIFVGMRAIICAALLSLAVNWLVQRFPWPVPMRLRFIALHLMAAPLYAVSWMILTAGLESALHSVHNGGVQVMVKAPAVPFVIMGIWFYVMVAGVSYASQAAQRAAIAEALAVSARLATLRQQLNPHFLFNALHTVVQLIPLDPRRASQAAEQLASLLRTSLEEDRDLVRLADEWTFVERYLGLERIRFGDRLQVTLSLDSAAAGALVPSFALQTLAENAVRHGAAPHVEATTLRIDARIVDRTLMVVVSDTGAGADPERMTHGGTGLARLRDRLRALFGDQSQLRIETAPGRGFTATMSVPIRREREMDT
jgi:anti-sigma regulatory factor (Ser/Thr protein kinase)